MYLFSVQILESYPLLYFIFYNKNGAVRCAYLCCATDSVTSSISFTSKYSPFFTRLLIQLTAWSLVPFSCSWVYVKCPWGWNLYTFTCALSTSTISEPASKRSTLPAASASKPLKPKPVYSITNTYDLFQESKPRRCMSPLNCFTFGEDGFSAMSSPFSIHKWGNFVKLCTAELLQ
ncbi:uncharacterized protein MICPUCDRAFT_54907 [Micromonas pusilla CCMP1545]|uniref:Predicted protein n=1 Tax=Micromonas pusilla (strain CCMP1545) TaxID=564608 RepID=C1NAH4_MICPC|nr:uncharacterized protein MICPUCDRAFT_54907 [Micromonas pusilla CCMP1545]EEH50890.1 predicted protein [Micromonas pusilla CCMP1545]|eukprot:XP_003064910.1 predicted protein [Micromonas pusilla CCMP1545]